MKKIAVIPARSGSKGLKDKNIIDLCGKPLMAYTIEAALKSGVFERVIVSTDSERYGAIAEQYGAEVMYRGASLSDDHATTFMVLEDLFGRLDEAYDYFVLLQPTSPLRDARHICEAVGQFEQNYDTFDFLVSVKEAEHASILVRPIEEDRSLKHFDTDFSGYRRQSFQEYTPNGAIYIGKIPAYLQQKHFFGKKSIAYFMTQFDSVDIDHPMDYWLAQECMKRKEEHCEK